MVIQLCAITNPRIFAQSWGSDQVRDLLDKLPTVGFFEICLAKLGKKLGRPEGGKREGKGAPSRTAYTSAGLYGWFDFKTADQVGSVGIAAPAF